MILARVEGVIVSSACHPSMGRYRTIICQPLDTAGAAAGAPVLALDPHGAPLHGRVIFSTDGSKTRELVGDPRSPLRNFVCALVDDESAAAAGTPNPES
jgi:microcompartment protein CcmK/EutM